MTFEFIFDETMGTARAVELWISVIKENFKT